MPIGYPGNSITKTARVKAGGGFESAISAAPSALENGQSITITGSGFEAVANPLPAAYDTFDSDLYPSGAGGATFPEGDATDSRWGPTSDGISSDGYEFDATVKMPGRAFSAKSLGKKSQLKFAKTQSGGPSRSASTMYSTHWMRLNEGVYVPPQPDEILSFKFARYWNDSAGTAQYHSLIFRDAPRLSGGDITAYMPVVSAFDTGGADAFHRIEFAIRGGFLSAWIDGKAITFENSGEGFTGKKVPTTYIEGDVWRTRLIGIDPSESIKINDALRNWIAEFYEQPTLARIELSNNASFNDDIEQARYYQIVNSRTTDTIVIPSLYLGAIDTDSPVYMHEIKSDETVVTTELVVGTNVEIA